MIKKKEKAVKPAFDPYTGLRLLEAQINKGLFILESKPRNDGQYDEWELITRDYLEKIFGQDSPNIRKVVNAGKYGSFAKNDSEAWWIQRQNSLNTQICSLKVLCDLLLTEEQLQSKKIVSGLQTMPQAHRIFLVHGHDEKSVALLSRYLDKLGQETILLREQPNCGRTIIEKFEDFADVGFAIVLLTPDDVGGTTNNSTKDLKPRARQNVILELGYFLGRLGRSRVCAMYIEGVEIPSDYSGVLYLEIDTEGAWRLKLAKELKAAGLIIDLNTAL